MQTEMTKELVELFWIDHKVQQKTGRCDVVWGNPWHGM